MEGQRGFEFEVEDTLDRVVLPAIPAIKTAQHVMFKIAMTGSHK